MPRKKRPVDGTPTNETFACPKCKHDVIAIARVAYAETAGGQTLASIAADGKICCSHLDQDLKVFGA